MDVLRQEGEHRGMHERGECDCEVVFDREDFSNCDEEGARPLQSIDWEKKKLQEMERSQVQGQLRQEFGMGRIGHMRPTGPDNTFGSQVAAYYRHDELNNIVPLGQVGSQVGLGSTEETTNCDRLRTTETTNPVYSGSQTMPNRLVESTYVGYSIEGEMMTTEHKEHDRLRHCKTNQHSRPRSRPVSQGHDFSKEVEHRVLRPEPASEQNMKPESPMALHGPIIVSGDMLFLGHPQPCPPESELCNKM